MSIETIQIDSKDLDLIISCAVRYALGRRTYVPANIAKAVAALIPQLSSNTLGSIRNDIEKYRADDNLGDKVIDEPHWLNLLACVINEIGHREAVVKNQRKISAKYE